ncbi:MAG: CpsD/CapB family tyrosine-protein kinase [Bacilli bacterium]|nr:CpsD/CapB family tyrosine-protein kinase [Bacilli bacterium]
MNGELVVLSRPKSNISEDIRTIRTNLKFMSNSSYASTILVTSSIPGEGKSFISSNLGVAFAKTEELTVIVDSDLRLGRIHNIFDVSNEIGLSDMLIEKDINNYVKYLKKTRISNLYVIPRGTVPPNPSELLNSNNMDRVLAFLKESFDNIIFDGVPVNGLPDSLIVADFVDNVVLVAKANVTKIDELNDAKKALEKIDAKIAGVVVNNVSKTKRGKYYKYYGYTRE